jgi:hypothetical protein
MGKSLQPQQSINIVVKNLNPSAIIIFPDNTNGFY